MKLKSLLFGSAAILAVGSGAQAADLPMAEPVDYVRICDAFGTGFYYIPGTDTCLKVGGRVRVEAHYVFGDEDDDDGEDLLGQDAEEYNNYTTRARGYLYLDARTQTDIGLVRAYIEMHMTVGPAATSGSNAVTDESDPNYGDAGNDLAQAFVQISNDMGTFTAGHTASFFDFWGSNGFGTRIGIDDTTNEATLFAYTFGAGNGISATLSFEDAASADRRYNGEDVYTGQEYPDVVANIRIEQGWGSAQVMGVLHDVHNGDSFDDHELGWAVGAGLSVTVPGIGAALNVVGGYSEGALGYITEDLGGVGDINDDGDLNTAWIIKAGVQADFTETIAASLDASYTSVEEADDFDSYNWWGVAGTLYYTPVSGLLIGAEVAYNNLEVDDADEDADVWGVMLRVQRTF
jgi:opacity protein-like surface antigen